MTKHYSLFLRALFLLVVVGFTNHRVGANTSPDTPECNVVCTKIYQPVCGLSCCTKTNVTFGNSCEMGRSNKCDGTDYIQICNMTCDECGGIVCRN